MAGHIILASGLAQSSDFRGRVEVRIDPVYVPGKSCLTVQAQPSTADLAEKHGFQDAVLRLLRQAGLLGTGSYRLVPARRHSLANNHLFAQLCRNNRDILQTFCLSRGAVLLPQPTTALPLPAGKRYSYRHRLVVIAGSERAARILAAGALPNHELWSHVELKQFKLESADHEYFTFTVEITLNAPDEERARKTVVDLFAPLVNPEDAVVTSLTGPRRTTPAAHNGRPRRQR